VKRKAFPQAMEPTRNSSNPSVERGLAYRRIACSFGTNSFVFIRSGPTPSTRETGHSHILHGPRLSNETPTTSSGRYSSANNLLPRSSKTFRRPRTGVADEAYTTLPLMYSSAAWRERGARDRSEIRAHGQRHSPARLDRSVHRTRSGDVICRVRVSLCMIYMNSEPKPADRKRR